MVITKSHDYGGLEAERCYTIYDFRDGYVDTLKGANKDADGKYYAYTGDEIKIASHYVATYGNGDNVTFRHNGTEGRWTVKHSTDVAMLSTEADACDPSHKDNTMTATGGTYAGADAKLTIAHQEFDGRTKQKSLTVYKKFEKTVHVTELHEMSIDLANAKDDEGQAIAELTDCELKMHDIGDCAYKDSNGNKITAEKKPLKWYSSDSVEDDAKGTGTYKSNKYVHSAVTTKAGKITIVTKAYKDGNPCVIGVIQDNLEIGTITVYTLPFKAATLVGMRDNIGYGKDTLNKKIYLEIENFYAGDDLYVFSRRTAAH